MTLFFLNIIYIYLCIFLRFTIDLIARLVLWSPESSCFHGNFSALTCFQTPSIVNVNQHWGVVIPWPQRKSHSTWLRTNGAAVQAWSDIMATKSWNRWSQCLYSTKKVDIYIYTYIYIYMYIYTAAVTVAKLAFRIFCDLDRKSRSLCLNYKSLVCPGCMVWL